MVEKIKILGREILLIALIALIMGVFTMIAWNLGVAKAIDGVNKINLSESIMVLTLLNTIKITIEIFGKVPNIVKQ